MDRDCIYSVNDLTREECLAIAVWMARFSDRIKFWKKQDEFQDLYNALVDKLELREHSRKVVDAVISFHRKYNLLTVKKSSSKKESPFCFKGEFSTIYREDYEISNNSGEWKTYTEDDVNLVRAVFANSRISLLPQIICWTFFSEVNDKRKTFKLPNDKSFYIPEKYSVLANNTEKVDFLCKAFSLNADEAILLSSIYASYSVREFYKVYNALYRDENRYKLYSVCTGKSLKDVKKILSKSGKLRLYGIIDEDGEMDDDVVDCISSGDINTFFCDVLKEDTKEETYNIDSYNVKEKKTNLALRLLKNEGAANILLYGAPGAGKTEYARSLVKASGLKSMIFKNEVEVDSNEENCNSKALCRLNCLLSMQNKDTVIIVDEAESVLQTRSSFLGYWFLSESDKKGTINKMIESTNNKIIWILNYTKPLDESTLRRFTYSIEFAEMSKSMLRNIADTKLNAVPMKAGLHNQIVDLCGKYHVTGASVDNIVKTVKGFNLSSAETNNVIDDVKEVLESNSTLVYGKKKMRETVRESYDLNILNTSVSPEKIFKMVRNAENFAEKNKIEKSGDTGIRMLFYGASGTGKTELARYIAEKLEKKIILKRASDILGPYVGQNEENIKDAFEEAENSGDILLFDEADSFFADRNSTSRSWERTMVNEFLTQMEEFSGILICTTNLREIMDPAMQRRFHILSEFKPLTRNGIETLLGKYFGAYSFSADNV